MTPQEKARAYDAALELAKEKREIAARNGAEITVKFLEAIFPGLCESEDEGVRKELINYHTLLAEKFKYDNMDRHKVWLAWLEKQKEQKPKNILTDDDSLQTAYLKGQTDVLEDPEAYGLQKEQKPAEVKDPFSNANFVRGYESGYNDAISEQKPVEWSEEDEKIIQSLIREIDKYVFFAGIEANKIVNFLKSLRPSWKPGNNTYKTIIHNILAMLKDLDFDKIAPDHRLSLLNDIRVRCKNADEQAEILDEPSWKPSEEQMSMLLAVLNDPNNAGAESCQMALKSLYEQLQKL